MLITIELKNQPETLQLCKIVYIINRTFMPAYIFYGPFLTPITYNILVWENTRIKGIALLLNDQKLWEISLIMKF